MMQELHMVIIDIGDDAQFGGDEVGGVEATAHAHFDDGDVDFFLGEIVEGHAYSHLEEGELHGLELLLIRVDELHHVLFRDHLAVDADAFAKVAEMGRGVEAGLVASFLEHGGQHVGDGTLAVGSAHVHRLEVVLRVVEKVKELDGVGRSAL